MALWNLTTLYQITTSTATTRYTCSQTLRSIWLKNMYFAKWPLTSLPLSPGGWCSSIKFCEHNFCIQTLGRKTAEPFQFFHKEMFIPSDKPEPVRSILIDDIGIEPRRVDSEHSTSFWMYKGNMSQTLRKWYVGAKMVKILGRTGITRKTAPQSQFFKHYQQYEISEVRKTDKRIWVPETTAMTTLHDWLSKTLVPYHEILKAQHTLRVKQELVENEKTSERSGQLSWWRLWINPQTTTSGWRNCAIY